MKLRAATMQDADFLLVLKNDPVMRKFAVVTHGKINRKDHLNWLKTHLNEVSIAVEGNEQIGMFRIADGEVSINLHPKFRGQGYGHKIMQHCPKGVWAKIVNGNVASMRLFLSNGFQITDYKENHYVLKN